MSVNNKQLITQYARYEHKSINTVSHFHCFFMSSIYIDKAPYRLRFQAVIPDNI